MDSLTLKNGKISTTFSYLDGLLNGPITIYDEKGMKNCRW